MNFEEDEFEMLMNEITQQSETEINQILHQMKTPNENKQNKESIEMKETKEMKEENDKSEEFQQNEMSEEDEMEQYKDKTIQIKRKKLEILNVNHELIEYPEIHKHLYSEVPSISQLSFEEVNKIRKNELEGCFVKGKRCPKPISKWSECGIHQNVYNLIKAMKFEYPTPVQRQAIPAIMSGFDVIVCAKTGSGKTLAYLLPLLKHVLSQQPIQSGDGPIALIFGPTHELVEQINSVVTQFTDYLSIRSTAIFGGMSVSEQIGALKKGSEIVVCTPAKMIDLLTMNNGTVTNLRRVSFVVLDEADRLLDSGFGPQITKILNAVRPDRQTVLFSATFPSLLEKHAREIMHKPSIEILFGGRAKVSDTIEEIIEVIEEEKKKERLIELITEQKGRIIVFCERQERCDEIYQFLMQHEKQSLLLHGGIDQIDRQNNIDEFKGGLGKNILVSTSVCARGLDVNGLELVINYDCPSHIEDYIHRVGRTGRAGKKGKAITFITKAEEKLSEDLIRLLTLAGKEIPNELNEMYDEWKLKKSFLGSSTKKRNGYKGSGYQFNEEEEMKRYERKLEGFISVDNFNGTNSNKLNSMNGMDDDERRNEGEMLQNALKEKQITEEMNRKHIPIEKHSMVRKALKAIEKINGKIAKTTSHGYSISMDINDFSHKCRSALTKIDNLMPIMQNCNVKISIKGTHIVEGSSHHTIHNSNNQIPLHLLIEGNSEENISMAKRQIKSLLDDILLQNKESIAKDKVLFNIV